MLISNNSFTAHLQQWSWNSCTDNFSHGGIFNNPPSCPVDSHIHHRINFLCDCPVCSKTYKSIELPACNVCGCRSRGIAVVTAKVSFFPDKISVLSKPCRFAGRQVSCFKAKVCFSAAFRPIKPQAVGENESESNNNRVMYTRVVPSVLERCRHSSWRFRPTLLFCISCNP